MNNEKQIIFLFVYVGIAVTLMVPFIVILGFKLRNRQIRYIKEKQQLEYNYKQEILNTQIEIQQQTLQTISQEIHDNISQLLSIVKIHLNTMQDSAEPTLHHQQIVKTNELVSRIILDLRNLSKGINPDFVQRHGLTDCVRFELERLQYTGIYSTDLTIQGTPYSLELSKEFVIYRVIQENINNIIRHAKAKEIRIELHYWPHNFRCSIFDNGQGFVVKEALQTNPSSSGSGMRNMQRRMEMIGGKINIKSILNLGTQVDLILNRQP